MTYPLTFVELFAGVGGLSLGLETAGWKCVGHAEWEAFPRRVLKHRWPDVPLWGDVSQLNGRDIVAEVGPFTMLTFGAPCQDFSIAGKRSGLDGERSVLVMDAMRIWEESGAPLALYENVVGMLSSNKGEDFAAILSVLIGSNVTVPARGWKGGGGIVRGRTGVAAWRVLDAQYFGVPQRRRRVFVLCSRDPRLDPTEVLALAEGLSGDTPKGRKTRKGSPADTGAGASGAGATGLAINISNGEPRVGDVMGTLQARASSGGVGSGAQMNAVLAFTQQRDAEYSELGLASTLSARDYKEATDIIVPTVLAFAQNTRDEVRIIPDDKVCALLAQPGMKQQNYVLTYEWHGQDSRVREIDVAASLNRNAEGREGHLVLASTYSTPAIGDIREDSVASTITKNSGGGGETQNAAFVLMTVREGKPGGGKGPLLSRDKSLSLGTGNNQVLFHPAEPNTVTLNSTLGIPRRLTPLECERLMGWPDNWTNVPDEKGKPAPDTARYKACGNGVASPVSAWIGFQLKAALTKHTL